MTLLEEYYGKFNENKRLTRPYAKVEFNTNVHYIEKYLEKYDSPSILDIGAGTGAYSLYFAKKGIPVTAVELVKYNLGILKKNGKALIESGILRACQGNALNLRKIDGKFDIILLFGPLYHLFKEEEQIKTLLEAGKHLKEGGRIFVSYCLNDYSIVSYGFREGHVREIMEKGLCDGDFHLKCREEDLFNYVRLNDIDRLNMLSGFKRDRIFASDGAANYIRKEIAEMDEETFSLFLRYQISSAERPETLGASAHVVDIIAF